MSLTNSRTATSRSRAMIALSLALTAFASASASTIIPQVTPAAAPRSPVVARQRCANCTDSTRIRRELLATRLDSLRTEFTRRRGMTDVERERLSKEMTTTIIALEDLIDASFRAGFSELRAREFAGAQAGGRRAPEPSRFTVTVQTAPRGHLGVTFDGPMVSDQERDSVRFFAYPLIAAVDPSSPADRAGVLRGDTLLALNGTDVIDHLFSFNKLLVPGEKITMKVRRLGDAKEFRIVVGERPAYVVQRWPAPAPAAPGAWATTPDAPGVPDPARVGVRAPAPVARAGTSLPQDGPEPGVSFGFPSRMFIVNAVGGARLEPLSEGLAKNLGVKGGLLVLRVTPATPAEQWGMLDGDIILTVAGESISSVAEFATLVVRNRDRAGDVKVVVLRDKKQQELIVK
jgi:hypothetical protein